MEIKTFKLQNKPLESHCLDNKIDIKSWQFKALHGYFGFIKGKEVSKDQFDSALKHVVFGKIG